MTDLASYISTEAGFKEAVRALDLHLKAQKFAELDNYLRGHMAIDRSSISQLCLKMPVNCAQFAPQSWTDLARGIVEANKDDGKVSAIGFDLTGHWEGEGPGFEVSIYSDKMGEGFYFSKQSHADLLAHAKYPTPWQGGFDHCDGFGPIKGLEALYSALYAYPNRDWSARDGRGSTAMPDGYMGYFLGLVFLHLRVQETFARELKHYGLPLEIPVLLGTHDFMGIFFPGHNVLINTTLALGAPSYEQIQIEKNIERLQQAKLYAAQQIDIMTKNWVTMRHVNGRDKSGKSQSMIESLEHSMNFILSMSKITPRKPFQKMEEAEFKSLMESYYKARLQRVA